MGELNKKPIHNVFKKYRQMNLVNPYRFQSNINPYADAVVVYSLKKEFTDTKAILQIRRSSDNATCYVFWNASGTVGLDSLIHLSSDVTPSATTLATWVGSNDAFVRGWFPQNSSNNRAKWLYGATNAIQPKFITAGVIETENGHPTIVFDGVDDSLYGASGQYYTELDYNLPSTLIVLSANKLTGALATLISTQNGASSYLGVINDRSASKRCGYANATTDGFANLTSQIDSSNERLLTVVNDGTLGLSSFYNGVAQGTGTFAGTYTNSWFGISFISASKLNGNVSIIVLYGSNKTSNLSAIHSAINSRYSIY